MLLLLARLSRTKFSQRGFTYKGVVGPHGTCSPETFRQAEEYEPRPEDVFVVSQMRSGTTWMQHLLYQVLTRGSGDLPGEDKTLNAVCSWLESFRAVDVSQAPLLGRDHPSRIIKTHLPTCLCPQVSTARYVYVVRHPLSCFASCADFVRNNLRGFAPSLEEIEQWFCSNEYMWWNTWVEHAAGWWHLAESQENVLLVRFEDMVDDLRGVTGRVSRFLSIDALDDAETYKILDHCSFASMKQHADAFEMHPPHLLQAANAFFVSGSMDRCAGIPAAVQQRLRNWCREACTACSFPVESLYPDMESDRTCATALATAPSRDGP